MSLKKRADGRYCKQIRINGKTKSFYGKTIREVNQKVLEYGETSESGEYFKSVADKWETFYLQQNSFVNYKAYGRCAFNTIVATFGRRRIKQITAADVNLFLQNLAAKDYAQKTVASYKSIFNQIFKFAVVNGYADNNPVSVVPLPKNLKKQKRELPSTEDILKVSRLHNGFGFLAFFLLYTGLRMSEALALDYKDVDRDKKLINVNKKVIHDGNTPVLINKTKTAAGTRQVILLDRVAEFLPDKKSGIIFCNENGGYLTKRQLHCRWEKMKKEEGLNLTAHQLRHAYATMLFEAGITERDAQELMGHADIHTTQSIYTHIRSERKNDTAAKLNNFNF